MLQANFKAWLSEDGVVVPHSIREGHNVFTSHGREWLARMSVWSSLGPDASFTEERLRWIGLGSGSLLELESVSGLSAPLTITTGPDEYLRVLGTLSDPVQTSAQFTTVFTGASADFDHHGASVDISEAGLFIDAHDGVGTLLDPSLAQHTPVAYKSFTPLTKLAAQTLTVTWELRF